MRKVELRAMEEKKYKIIKNLVDNNGNKHRAKVQLNLTIRSINRLINVYKTKGKSGFIHGNRNKIPSNTISPESKEKIVRLYNETYYDFNFKHFKETLKELENIDISYNALYKILDSNLILSPKAERKTKKAYRKRIKTKIDLGKKLLTSEKKLIMDNDILNPKASHARLPRKKYAGELLQMDASEHLWFGDTKTHLHAAIDDSTGTIIGAYFDEQETLKGYYNVLKQVLEGYGIPNEFLTDRRTIFDYKSLKNPQPEYDSLTQFGYACEQLGIKLSVTSVPQAKGRIERLFGTLQSRLINELRLQDIGTIDKANEFLKSYIHEYNNRFSLIKHNIPHVYVKLKKEDDLNLILAVISTRKFDTGSSIQYKNKCFLAYGTNGRLINFRNKTKAVVIDSFDKNLYALVNNKHYKLIELPSHESLSKEFDPIMEKEVKPKYVVPNDHPWKGPSYEAYLRKLESK